MSSVCPATTRSLRLSSSAEPVNPATLTLTLRATPLRRSTVFRLLTVVPEPGRLASVRHAFHDVGIPQPPMLNGESQWQVLCPAENVEVLEAAVAGKATVTKG